MAKLTECLIEITRKTLGVLGDGVTRSTRFVEDLGADSIDCVELMMAMEERFEIEFADDELSVLTTIAAVENFLQRCAADKPVVRSLMAA